ncbi:unnamed protein product [Lactuca virosa]|uniref:Uncharacterized protein n=1 Tax=Lactuca virosa TaxID=75947 RepID=A0AAU9NX24_9ASTR|nr:unnamed protein product [Lactuca virosa]
MVNTRSSKEVSKSSCQLQRKLDLVKTKEPEPIDPIKISSKRRSTASLSLDGLLTPKNEDTDHTLMMQTDIHIPEKRTLVDDPLWRGNAVGKEVKELLEAVEHHYPNTFQRVQIRVKPFWSAILEGFHATIKRFMGTSVDALTVDQIASLQEDLNELEGFKFDLSWALKRLDIVDRLKFGNEPLQKELMALEDSLDPLKATVDMRWKQLMEARDMYKREVLEYENAIDARNKKTQEMEQMFGADFDRVLKSHLGFGLLPGY